MHRHLGNPMLLAACLTVTTLGCDFTPPPLEVECPADRPAETRIVGSASAWVVATALGDAVHVEGRTRHLDGLAIRQIRAAEALASPADGAFNFSQWAVDVPVATLDRLLPDPDTGAISVPVVARDACDFEYNIADIAVVITGPAFVDTLALTATPPADETYLPTTLSLPASIRVVAVGDPAGLMVKLTASSGRFAGAQGDGTEINLPLMPTLDGVAEVLAQLTGDTPGEVLITATAGGLVKSTRVFVAGPPVFFPAEGQLLPGSTPVVDVLTDGRLSQCEIRVPTEVVVTYRGLPIQGTVTIDGQPGEDVRFQFAVDPALVDTLTATLLCRDTFGQAASATFVVGP